MPPHHLVSSQDWAANLPDHLTEIAELLIPARTERTCPRAVNAPATTTTASRNPANPPASATPGRPPSCCTASTPAQHDQLTLRGIGRKPIGAKTAATSSHNASVCSRVPLTSTKKSSAYLTSFIDAPPERRLLARFHEGPSISHFVAKCSSNTDRAIFASSGDRIPPCGVPVIV